MDSSSHPQLPLSFHTQQWVESEGAASVVDILHYTFEMLIKKPSLWHQLKVSPVNTWYGGELMQHIVQHIFMF